VTSSELDELIAGLYLPGWWFWTQGSVVHLRVVDTPEDTRLPDAEFTGLADQFVVQPSWTDRDVLNRLFCNLQYLIDHELREHFTYAGVPVFDAHDPPVTGFQKEWFVEHQSALAGY
jgi:hypothetical protein